MLWLEITAERFPEAVETADGLCLLPFGVIERHAAHLPLGTDQIAVDETARRAAEREPAVVFPSYWFGKIFTARHYPGTFCLRRDLIFRLLEATCDEIARNGFDKILIVNGHGGNNALLHYFVRSMLDEPRGYVVYATNTYQLDDETRRRWEEMRESAGGEHADEGETSIMLHLRPGLVRMEDMTGPEDGRDRGWQDHLEGLDHPLGWYARFPTHYSGDARTANAEKGEFLFEAHVERLVRLMRAVKGDDVTPELMQGFYRKAERPAEDDSS
jgi:creatinine amidohydrolase